MRTAIYNSSIPRGILNPSNRARRIALSCLLFPFMIVLAISAREADWSAPEQQLSRKIVAVTGPGAVAISFESRSSLNRRDQEIIQNGLRAELESLGLRFVSADQAAATIRITLSENPGHYVWVAEIRQAAGENAVVMTSAPRAGNAETAGDSVPLTLRKIPLWSQDSPILDVEVLEENVTPTRIAVLDSERVALYRWTGGRWEEERTFGLGKMSPLPHDLRGRLLPAADHFLDVYLPGRVCMIRTPTAAATCSQSDDPWPLSGATSGVTPMKAFFTPARNFFTGALAPGVGRFTTVPKFYAAAPLPRDKYTLWLFAAVDGQVHMIDGVSDQVVKLGWGSDIASVRTSCGAGWQVLTSSPADQNSDSIRAYEFPDRDPVAVTAAVDFQGPVTALWTEAKGDTAVAVARNERNGSYEAFRLAVVCNQ